MKSWLSCEVSEKDARQPRSVKPSVFISIPKKVIPLATGRNRVKRLIREAMRENPYLHDPGKVYFFKVIKAPLKPSLADIKSFIDEIS